jgi:hypothetical protein
MVADGGTPVRSITQLLFVCISYVSEVLSHQWLTGRTTALAQRYHVRPKLAELHDASAVYVAAQADATLAEIRTWLLETRTILLSNSVPDKKLTTLKVSDKKKSLLATEQNRPDAAKAHAALSAEQASASPSKPVFNGETWTKTKVTQGYGHAPRKWRAVDAVPHGHWKTSTLIRALHSDDLTALLRRCGLPSVVLSEALHHSSVLTSSVMATIF